MLKRLHFCIYFVLFEKSENNVSSLTHTLTLASPILLFFVLKFYKVWYHTLKCDSYSFCIRNIKKIPWLRWTKIYFNLFFNYTNQCRLINWSKINSPLFFLFVVAKVYSFYVADNYCFNTIFLFGETTSKNTFAWAKSHYSVPQVLKTLDTIASFHNYKLKHYTIS